MKSALSFTWFLAALLSEGDGLSCLQCSNSTGTSCAGPAQNCSSPTQVCSVQYSKTILDGQVHTNFQMLCGALSHCDQNFSLSTKNASFHAAVACCVNDSCIPETPILIPKNTTKNNVTCPWCFSLNFDDCPNSKAMQCTGAETKCMQLTDEITAGNGTTMFSRGGCATENLCGSHSSYSTNGTNITTVIKCTSSSIRPGCSLSLMALAGLLTLKVFS